MVEAYLEIHRWLWILEELQEIDINMLLNLKSWDVIITP